MQKMNIDTDTQWAYWDGVRAFEAANRDYLQGQIGNPDGADKPNKKKYDPRVWLRKAEESMVGPSPRGEWFWPSLALSIAAALCWLDAIKRAFAGPHPALPLSRRRLS